MKNEEIQLKTQQLRELQEQVAHLKEQIDHQSSSNQQIIVDKSKLNFFFFFCLGLFWRRINLMTSPIETLCS